MLENADSLNPAVNEDTRKCVSVSFMKGLMCCGVEANALYYKKYTSSRTISVLITES